MSDELQRLPDWAFNLLQTTEDENREERHMAKLQAEASLQRAKNKGVILNAFLNGHVSTVPSSVKPMVEESAAASHTEDPPAQVIDDGRPEPLTQLK